MPIGVNKRVDQELLLGCDGLEASLVGGGERVEVGKTLAADDERLGVNAGFQGILRGCGFALGGAWAG